MSFFFEAQENGIEVELDFSSYFKIPRVNLNYYNVDSFAAILYSKVIIMCWASFS